MEYTTFSSFLFCVHSHLGLLFTLKVGRLWGLQHILSFAFLPRHASARITPYVVSLFGPVGS